MARIAIVETYPYESVWGGDAVYLDRIRQFLLARGHSVESYITNVSRGRASPLLRLHSRASGDHRWIVRRAMEWRPGRFLSWEPSLLLKALARLLGRRAIRDHEVTTQERSWVIKRLAASPPDIILLTFGACRFAKAVCQGSSRVMAIQGFFGERTVRLGENAKAAETPVGAAILDELRCATSVGFNNLMDLREYERATGAANGVLMGMSFPQRRQTPPGDEPAVLFVGARTKPNIQALAWFIEGAWPLVLAAVPSARLRVVGSVGSAFRKDTAANIELKGFVDDLDDEYGRAQLVVAPLLAGTNGVKTKVAEALSYGRPLVTTSIGVDPGDPDQFGKAVDVADTPAEFAAAVIRLLTDAPFRRKRNAMARAQFDRHFSEEAAYAALIAILGSSQS